jgi:hypothetical protein
MSRAAVSEATTQPRSSLPMTRGADAVGITSGIQRVFVHEDEAERAAQSGVARRGPRPRGCGRGWSARSAVTSAVSVVLPPRELAAVGRRPSRRPSTRSRSSAEFVRLPLWASATVPPAWPPRVGWAFSPRRAAGGGVAAVAHCEVAAQRRQRALVEDLGDQAHVLVDQQPLPVGRRDAGRLLPAVLEGIEGRSRSAWRRPHRGPRPRRPRRHPAGPFSPGIRSWLRRPSPRGTCPILPHPAGGTPPTNGQERFAAPIEQHGEHGREQTEHQGAHEAQVADAGRRGVVRLQHRVAVLETSRRRPARPPRGTR